MERKSLIKAKELWEQLGDIPVNESGEYIEQKFLHFEKGDELTVIWHWFEDEFDLSIAIDLMGLTHTSL